MRAAETEVPLLQNRGYSVRTTNDPQPIGALFPGAIAVMLGAQARLAALLDAVAAPAPLPTRSPVVQAEWNGWLAERQAGA